MRPKYAIRALLPFGSVLLLALLLLHFTETGKKAIAQEGKSEKIDSLYQAIQLCPKDSLPGLYMEMVVQFYRKSRFDSAKQYLELARPLLKEGTLDHARWHRFKATWHLAMGHWQESIQMLDKAADLLGKMHFPVEDELLNVHSDKGKIYIQLNQFDSAHHHYNQALNLLKSIPQNRIDTALLSLMYNNIGALHFYENKLDSALEYYDKARTLAVMKKGENDPSVARTLYNIGLVKEAKGYYIDAIYFYEKALAVYQQHFGDTNRLIAEVYGALGSAYLSRHETERAIHFFEKDMAIVRKLLDEDHPEMAWGYESIGRAHLDRNQKDLAVINLEKALRLREKSYGQAHSEMVDNLILLSRASIDDIPKSTLLASKALEMDWTLSSGFSFRKADALLLLSELQAKAGQHSDALHSADSAIHMLEALVKDGRHPSLCEARLQKAYVYLKQGNLEKAYLWADRAIDATTEATYTRNQGQPVDEERLLFEPQFLRCLLTKAEMLEEYYRQTHDPLYLDKIIGKCLQAMPVISKLQYLQTSEDVPPTIDSLFNKIYGAGLKASALLHSINKEPERLEQVLFFAEQVKNRSLASAIRSIDLLGVADVPEATLRREYQLKKDIRHYRSMLEAADLESDETSASEIREKLERLYQDQDRFYSNMRKHHPAYMKMRYSGDPVSIKVLQEKILRADEMMVHITRSGDELLVLMLGKNTFELKRHPLREWRPEMTLRYISDRKNINNLIWIPDPAISALMPETARLDGRLAIERFSFIYNSSAWMYARKPEKKEADNRKILAFAPVDFGTTGLPDLKHSEMEVRMIARNYQKVTPYLRANATAANFLKEMSRYPVIHLATHAELHQNVPLKSMLHFFPDSTQPHVLFAHELFGQPMRAKMVVLSACRTVDESGLLEGSAGIAAAFAYNGCRNILMSVHEQDDQAAMQIMSSFYRFLAQGKNKAKALQLSKLDYLHHADRYRTDPKFWSGIILTGDHEPFHLQPRRWALNWWVPALLALVVALLYNSRWWVRLRV